MSIKVLVKTKKNPENGKSFQTESHGLLTEELELKVGITTNRRKVVDFPSCLQLADVLVLYG